MFWDDLWGDDMQSAFLDNTKHYVAVLAVVMMQLLFSH